MQKKKKREVISANKFARLWFCEKSRFM